MHGNQTKDSGWVGIGAAGQELNSNLLEGDQQVSKN